MNIFTAYSQGAQLRRQDQADEARNALSTAVQQSGPRSPQAFNALAGVDPVAAMQMAQPDPRAAQAQREAAIGLVRGVLQAPEEARPQLYAQALQQAQAMGLDLAGVPQQYPGDMGLQAMGAVLGMSDPERTEFERLLATIPEDQRQQAILTRLNLAPSADAQLRVGASQSQRDPIAALRARAQEAGLRPGTPEYAQFMVSGGSQSGLAVDVDPASGAVSVRQGAGAGRVQRPFTEGQSKDVVYATRARGALEAFEPLADRMASFGDRALNMDPTGALRGEFQSPEFQVAQNAGNEFLQAILRKDTGAAITADEQALYGQTYLPQPGDGPEVMAEKARARQRAIAAIEAGMSPAQMIAQERGLSAAREASPPEGIEPELWQEMTPEERQLFGGQGAENPSEPAAAGLVNRIAFVESSGDPNARNPRSSATGLGQFVDATWIEMIQRHRPDLAEGRSRDDVLALRYDPQLSQEMIQRYADDNAQALQRAGFEATPGNIYLAHFAGPGGAVKALRADPSTPLQKVLGEAAIKANPTMRGKTAGWLVRWAERKMNGRTDA